MAVNKDKSSSKDLVIWLDETHQRKVGNILMDLEATVFSDRDECVDHITNLNNVKVQFVISGDDIQGTLHVINALEQIQAIYVFNPKEEKDLHWTTHFGKVRFTQREIQIMKKKFRFSYLVDQGHLHTRRATVGQTCLQSSSQ